MREIVALSEEHAFELFRAVRRGRDGGPVGADGGAIDQHWLLPSRQQWRGRARAHSFSVTSGTLFAHHKLPWQVDLGAIALNTHAVKGISALPMSRDRTVQYKTAFESLHSIRESLMARRDETPLAGAVEMDGVYVGGAVRPANRVEDRLDRRLGENQDPDRRCVLVLRETPPASEAAVGAPRTRSFVLHRENPDDVTALAKRFITAGTRGSRRASQTPTTCCMRTSS